MAVTNPKHLSFAGPVAESGFPMWIEDGHGVRLELAINNDPYTPAIGALQQPGAPVSFPANFPDEAFYFLAEARLDVGGDGVVGGARVSMALAAAFGGNGTPAPGANVVFSRLRVRIDDVIPGDAYVVKHPYGETDELVADERGRVFETVDLGISEGNTARVLETGQVAPFLAWTDGARRGNVGDGTSGATADAVGAWGVRKTLTGSELGRAPDADAMISAESDPGNRMASVAIRIPN